MEYIWELLKFLLIIGVFAYGGFFLVKKIQKKQMTQTSVNGVITVTDAVKFGANDRLFVLKIGEEYVAYATGSAGVDLLRLEQKEISIPKKEFDELFQKGTPAHALKHVTKVVGDKMK